MKLTCDTSVLVPALTEWHEGHAAARAALADVSSVPTHALIECYSVLTRLPHGRRIAPEVAAAAVGALGWEVLDLPVDEQLRLIAACAAVQISGGAIYDALIGATAKQHGLTLLTRDQRARRAYDALGIAYVLV